MWVCEHWPFVRNNVSRVESKNSTTRDWMNTSLYVANERPYTTTIKSIWKFLTLLNESSAEVDGCIRNTNEVQIKEKQDSAVV